MNSIKRGICHNCKKNFTYSIGTPHIPFGIEGEDQNNITTWFNSIGQQCYECKPVPEKYKKQCGVLMWRCW